jgi:hypothetical protein
MTASPIMSLRCKDLRVERNGLPRRSAHPRAIVDPLFFFFLISSFLLPRARHKKNTTYEFQPQSFPHSLSSFTLLSTSGLALSDNIYRHKNRHHAAAARSLLHPLLPFLLCTYSFIHSPSPAPRRSPLLDAHVFTVRSPSFPLRRAPSRRLTFPFFLLFLNFSLLAIVRWNCCPHDLSRSLAFYLISANSVFSYWCLDLLFLICSNTSKGGICAPS